jgi:hypothetical protein
VRRIRDMGLNVLGAVASCKMTKKHCYLSIKTLSLMLENLIPSIENQKVFLLIEITA